MNITQMRRTIREQRAWIAELEGHLVALRETVDCECEWPSDKAFDEYDYRAAVRFTAERMRDHKNEVEPLRDRLAVWRLGALIAFAWSGFAWSGFAAVWIVRGL